MASGKQVIRIGEWARAQASKIGRAGFGEIRRFRSLDLLVIDREIENRSQMWERPSSDHREHLTGGLRDVRSDKAGA